MCLSLWMRSMLPLFSSYSLPTSSLIIFLLLKTMPIFHRSWRCSRNYCQVKPRESFSCRVLLSFLLSLFFFRFHFYFFPLFVLSSKTGIQRKDKRGRHTFSIPSHESFCGGNEAFIEKEMEVMIELVKKFPSENNWCRKPFCFKSILLYEFLGFSGLWPHDFDSHDNNIWD